MYQTHPIIRGVTAKEFFAMTLAGASMQEAHYGARIAYSTVYRAAQGTPVSVPVALALAEWSRTVPSAIAAHVAIDAALAAGLTVAA